jgi:hypothetical protein
MLSLLLIRCVNIPLSLTAAYVILILLNAVKAFLSHNSNVKITMIKPELSRWKIGLVTLALLAVCPVLAYAEVAPTSDGSAPPGAAALEENGQPLEDSLPTEEQPEGQVQTEEQLEDERIDAANEEINQNLHEGASTTEASEGANGGAEVSPEAVGEDSLPDANEDAVDVDL